MSLILLAVRHTTVLELRAACTAQAYTVQLISQCFFEVLAFKYTTIRLKTPLESIPGLLLRLIE